MSGGFGFDYPWVLSSFVLFIPLILFDLFSSRRKLIKQHLPRSLGLRLLASRVFFRIFLGCFIIALASPRWGLEQSGGEYRRGLDVVIAIDVSRSMEIRDVPGGRGTDSGTEHGETSRLERGLSIVREAVSAVPGPRFAAAVSRNRGLLAVPLTWDNSAVLSFLDAAGSSMSGSGTNLESLVDAAATAFQSSFPFKRLIILVSDGEALSGSLKAALERCNYEGIMVSALAVGSDEGSPVPGQEDSISRRDQALMRLAAEQTGGIYIDGNLANAAAALSSHLRSLGNESESSGGRRERKARWPLFIMAAIICYGASKLSLFKRKDNEE
ncbi:MAG: VWA domain-containing protein [Treponema sp.]|jgi:Ca-activated chloride channel family protein|nr:VWA domain-containing protein [Treponema sp.]